MKNGYFTRSIEKIARETSGDVNSNRQVPIVGEVNAVNNANLAEQQRRGDVVSYDRFSEDAAKWDKMVRDKYDGNYELAADAITGIDPVYPEMYFIGGTKAYQAAKPFIPAAKGAAKAGLRRAGKFIPSALEGVKNYVNGNMVANYVNKVTGNRLAAGAARNAWKYVPAVGSAVNGASNFLVRDPSKNLPYVVKKSPQVGLLTSPLYTTAAYSAGKLLSLAGKSKYIQDLARYAYGTYSHNSRNGTLVDVSPTIGGEKITPLSGLSSGIKEGILGGDAAGNAKKAVDDVVNIINSVSPEDRKRIMQALAASGRLLESGKNVAKDVVDMAGTNNVDTVSALKDVSQNVMAGGRDYAELSDVLKNMDAVELLNKTRNIQ